MTTAIPSLRSWLGNTDYRNEADVMLPLSRDEIEEIVAEYAALEAAAREALEGITTIQEETSITAECEVCSLCGWGINHHNPACSHAALAALLALSGAEGLAERDALEDRAAEMQTGLDLCLADLQALRAAARAVVDAVWSPSTNVYLAGSLICRICMSPDGRHSPSCPVRTLTALLEEEPS